MRNREPECIVVPRFRGDMLDERPQSVSAKSIPERRNINSTQRSLSRSPGSETPRAPIWDAPREVREDAREKCFASVVEPR